MLTLKEQAKNLIVYEFALFTEYHDQDYFDPRNRDMWVRGFCEWLAEKQRKSADWPAMTEQKTLFDDEEQRKLDAEEKRVIERKRLVELQVLARNKVPPKPPQVYDDSEIIPF